MTNWWEAGGATGCIAAYQPLGAASYAASKVDLSGSGHNAADIAGGMNWDANGWTPGAGCLSVVVLVGMTYTAIVQFADMIDGQGDNLFGAESAAGSFALVPNDAGGVLYVASNAEVSSPPSLLAGNLAIAGSQGYRNGVLDAALVPGLAPTVNIYVGGRNSNGSPLAMSSGRIKAFALYDNTQNAAKVLAVRLAMALLGLATPQGRAYTMPAEDRIFAVPFQDRTYQVPV